MIQIRHPEYYPKLVAIGQLTEPHFYHCVEALRKAILCRGEMQLSTFQWDPSRPNNISGLSDQTHKCVKWDQINDWARSRSAGRRPEFVIQDDVAVAGPVDLL